MPTMANMFVTKVIKHIVACMMWMSDQLIVYSYDLSWEIYKHRTRYSIYYGIDVQVIMEWPLTRELSNYTSLCYTGNRYYKNIKFNDHYWNQS